MGRTKAKKKVHPMPKLGFRDRCVYALGYLLILAVLVVLFRFRFCWIEDQAMAEPGAVAYEAHGSIFWYFPFYLAVMLSLFIPWQHLHSSRYPFFGRRGVKYGPPAYPRTFPLFMKNKPQYWKSPRKARMRRTAGIAVVALNLVLALLVPLSIHGRNMLYEDGSLRDFSMLDQVKGDYGPEDAEEVTLHFGRYKSGKHSYRWRLVLTIDYGGREYTFYDRSFSGADWVDDLERLLEQFDPGIIRTDGENLDAFAGGRARETVQKLRELLEQYAK